MAVTEVGAQTMPGTPGTPGTPGGPLFTALQLDSLTYERSDRKTVPGCMCFPVDAPAWSAPQTCFSTAVSVPYVSLTRKVLFSELSDSFLDYLFSSLFVSQSNCSEQFGRLSWLCFNICLVKPFVLIKLFVCKKKSDSFNLEFDF